MKPLKFSFALILIGSTLLLSVASESGESKNPRNEQNKNATEKDSKKTEQREKEPTIPLAAFQATQSALLEAIRTISAQQEAAQKQKEPQYDPWYAPSVVAQYLLVVVGSLYTLFAWRQWAAIKEQAEIARKTLDLSNRPRLRARSFFVTNWEECGGDNIFVHFKAVNYGGSDAYIIDSNLTVWLAHVSSIPDLPMLPPYDRIDQRNQIAASGKVFRVGEPFYCSKPEPISEENNFAAVAGYLRLYVIGYITYRGSVGNTYTTAFCEPLSNSV